MPPKLQVPNSFTFKYFFGGQVLRRALTLAKFICCDVFEFNHMGAQRNYVPNPKLQITSLMFPLLFLRMDVPLIPKSERKVEIDDYHKFQEVWALKISWVDVVVNEVGLFPYVRCCVCIDVERKENVLWANLDSIEKYACKIKTSNCKWLMYPKYGHAKNEMTYV